MRQPGWVKEPEAQEGMPHSSLRKEIGKLNTNNITGEDGGCGGRDKKAIRKGKKN